MSLIKPYRFYPKAEIERRASDLLMRMQLTPNWEPIWPFQADRVADFLDLGVVWDKIPGDATGPIAAQILPRDRLIEINEEILDLPEGFQQSTIAHEIGHWMLHINYSILDLEVEQLDLQSKSSRQQQFVCRANSGLEKVESIEWQAQYFASCLLMPRYILEEKCQGSNFNLLRWSHLYALRDELGVSISNLVNRLQYLGWIEVHKGSRKIYPGTATTQGQTQKFG